MVGTKIVIYGLSTEGYSIGRQMAIKGADVFIIDESAPSAFALKSEIAKAYPNISSIKEDEPLLSMEPIDVAISKAEYLFFAPRIRKTGQDTKTEIHSKFKDATSALKKNSSVIYGLPTGFNGNSENISLLEHITGFQAGKTISYYYYPLSVENNSIIGSFDNKTDKKLADLLSTETSTKNFISLLSSEHFHAIKILIQFSTLCSIVEVCKFAQDEQTRNDLSSDKFNDIFLDDMVNGLYDLRSLSSSFEGGNTLMYLINGGIKGMDGYIKRLIDEIRATLKKNNLKASKTKIAISWTLDQHEMRGDKIEMLQNLSTRLRDYIGDVESYDESNFDMFHTEKTTIIVACSKHDYEDIVKNKKNKGILLVQANPLCKIFQQN